MQATHVTIWPGDEQGLDDDDGGDGDDDDGSGNDDDGYDEDGDSDEQSGPAGCTRNCLTWVQPRPEFSTHLDNATSLGRGLLPNSSPEIAMPGLAWPGHQPFTGTWTRGI